MGMATGVSAKSHASVGKEDLLEQTPLYKGVSPDGIAYRLSPVFDKYPDAML